MSTEPNEESTYGIESRIGWPVAGVLGGAIGAAAFGLVMWLFDPEIVQVSIPAFYGLEAGGVVGWGIHIVHGAILGVVFGYIITRELVLGVLRTDPETDALSEAGVALRIVGAGFAFGLTVWAIIPVIVLPAFAGPVGGEAASEFPGTALQSLLGHVLFGVVLGTVFAATMDVYQRPAESPLEE
ncbi:hypothetical protein [Halostagnicola kamekurae]|uniref:Histidine kinase n=1 Tax=Halostagnicola kamekurae TaxID=619731 RepID=A0A1I6SCW0_9EURY|nr:hypothetical protein [Halostagnicola kamekurae]SFS74801.1 hypothetical protein SAMN04488556_2575 [Halostagnicola kamekurae]